MKNRLLAFPVLAILAACGGEATEQAVTTEEPQDYAAGANAATPTNTAAGTNAAGASADRAAVAALADYYETHFNMGHGSMVAGKFAENGLSWTGNGGMAFGREAIGAALTAQIEATSPTIDLTQDEILLFGDYAVTRGTFSLTGTLDGAAIENTGNYMSVSSRGEDGTWRIEGGVSNFDSEGQPTTPSEAAVMPAGEGAELLADGVGYYVTHMNMGHGSMVAERYTPDAVAMMSGAPPLMGRAAVEGRLNELAEAGVKMEITPWSAMELDADHVTGIGTYSLETPEGSIDGHFAGLWKRGDDGELRAHWVLSGNHPMGM